MFKVPEKLRVKGISKPEYGNNGLFAVSLGKDILKIIASDGEGWEHVSVSLPYRCPTWEEMNFIKNLFWSKNDLVVQFHPPQKNYVNDHPYCLHLWRKSNTNDYIELPDQILV